MISSRGAKPSRKLPTIAGPCRRPSGVVEIVVMPNGQVGGTLRIFKGTDQAGGTGVEGLAVAIRRGQRLGNTDLDRLIEGNAAVAGKGAQPLLLESADLDLYLDHSSLLHLTLGEPRGGCQ